jgi:hypothetical protein
MIEKIHPYSDLCCRLAVQHCSIFEDNYVNILNSILSEIRGYECDFIELMACEFRRKYTFVRAVHASKPVDVEDISNKGLSVFTVDDYFLMAQSIFLNDNYPSITKGEVRCAVEKTATEGYGRAKNLHFFLTEFYKQCTHYCEFGSEFMLVVANNLGVKNKYTENVKEKGSPTIFVCNVPVNNISDGLIRDCLRIAICYLLNPLLENSTPLQTKDVGISIDCGLSPSNIVCHHPFP